MTMLGFIEKSDVYKIVKEFQDNFIYKSRIYHTPFGNKLNATSQKEEPSKWVFKNNNKTTDIFYQVTTILF